MHQIKEINNIKEASHNLTIVIPTYNEIKNLPILVNSLLELELPNIKILIVDDNSPDGTGQLANEFSQKFKNIISVLHRSQKSGLGRAYIEGFNKAFEFQSDFIIQMDADLSHKCEYIPKFINFAEEYDLIIGSRYIEGAGIDKSWGIYRKALSLFANKIYVKSILRTSVNDSTSGFRLWRSEALKRMHLERIRSNGYVFQIEMMYIASLLGYRITEIPIYFPNRKKGESKMNYKIALEAVYKIWEVLLHNRNLKPIT
jgi:dolichol-phosphate mannosyltransferase